jgi:hypothetical protein
VLYNCLSVCPVDQGNLVQKNTLPKGFFLHPRLLSAHR